MANLSELLNPTSAQPFGAQAAPGGATTVAIEGYSVGVATADGAATIKAPADPTQGNAFAVEDLDGDADANAITVDGNGKTIDGAATATIDHASAAAVFVFDGAMWRAQLAARAITSAGIPSIRTNDVPASSVASSGSSAAQPPASSVPAGSIYSTTEGLLETSDGTSWRIVAGAPSIARPGPIPSDEDFPTVLETTPGTISTGAGQAGMYRITHTSHGVQYDAGGRVRAIDGTKAWTFTATLGVTFNPSASFAGFAALPVASIGCGNAASGALRAFGMYHNGNGALDLFVGSKTSLTAAWGTSLAVAVAGFERPLWTLQIEDDGAAFQYYRLSLDGGARWSAAYRQARPADCDCVGFICDPNGVDGTTTIVDVLAWSLEGG